jgi:hypothetical protein
LRLYSYLVHDVELKNDLALVWRELPGLGLLELLQPAGELRLPPLQQVLRPRVRLLLVIRPSVFADPGCSFWILIFFLLGSRIKYEQKKRGTIFFLVLQFYVAKGIKKFEPTDKEFKFFQPKKLLLSS